VLLPDPNGTQRARAQATGGARTGILVALALAFALGVAHGAAAQTRRQPTQPEGPLEGTDIPVELRFADLRLGPVFLQPRVGLKELGWDSNVLGAPNNTETKIADFRATPSGGLKIAIPIRTRHLFTVDGQMDYQWFFESDELRAWNSALDASYAYTAQNWDFELTNRYADTATTQLDRLELGDQPVEGQPDVFLRARQTQNITRGEATWELGRNLVLRGQGVRRFYAYEDEILASDLGRTEIGVGGAIGYRLTTTVTTSLVANWQRDNYTEPGNLRNAETYRAGIELDLDPAALISGTVLVAYRDQAPRSAQVEGFSGVVTQGSLSVAPRGIAQLTVSGYRDIFPTIWAGSLYGLREGAGAELLFQTNRTVAIGGGVSYYEHSYPNEATRAQPDGSSITAKRRDQIVTFDARVRININVVDAITIRLGQYRRESNFDSFDTTGLIFTSGYGVTF